MNTTKDKKVKNFEFGLTRTLNSSILPNIIDKNVPKSQLFMTTKNQNHKTLFSSQVSTKNPEKSKAFAKFPKKSKNSGQSTQRSIKNKTPQDHNRFISVVEIDTPIEKEKIQDLQENIKEETHKTQKTEELFNSIMQALSEEIIFGTKKNQSFKVKNLSKSTNSKKKIMEILYEALDSEAKENDESKDMNIIQYNQKCNINKGIEENKEENYTNLNLDCQKNKATEEIKLDFLNGCEASEQQNDFKTKTYSGITEEINEDIQFNNVTGIKSHKGSQSQRELNFVNDLTKNETKTEETQLDINQDVSPSRKFKAKSMAFNNIKSTKSNSITLSDFKTLKADNYEQTTDNNFKEKTAERKNSSNKFKLPDDNKNTTKQKNKELKQKLKDENETISILKQDLSKIYEKYKTELREKSILIQKLYEKIHSLQAENSNFTNKIQLLEKNITNLQTVIGKKEKTTETLKSNLNEAISLNLKIHELKEKTAYFEHKNVNLQMENTKIQSEFEAYKNKTQENEAFFEASIKKLTALVQNNSRHTKNSLSHIKKNNFINEKLEENRIEENQKLRNKLQNMNEDIVNHKNHIEKYKRDFEYLNKLIEEKKNIDKEIMYRHKCEIDDETLRQRKKTIREIYKFIKEFEKSRGKFFDMQSCENCRKNTVRQVVIPCDNRLCKRTDDVEDVCPNCNAQGKWLKIRMIKELIVEIKNKFME